MTVGQAIEEMLRWLDEATLNGTPTPPDQIADLKERARYLMDGAVKYIAGQFKIPAVHSIVRAPIKNLLDTGFGTETVMPPEIYSASAEGGRSFYLEVSGTATITVSAGREPEEYEVSSSDYTAVKANIDAASGATAYISVASDYPFSVRRAAIYPCTFASDEEVQEYIPFVPYELPDDFREFDSLLQTSDAHEYRRFPDYRREGYKTFLLPYGATGQFDFHYFRNPADIPYNASDDTVVEVQKHAAQLIPLKLAVDVCIGVDEYTAVGHYLESKFQNTLVNLMTTDIDVNVIESVYNMT